MYEVVSGLLEVFSAMFQGYCLWYFFGSFLEGRIRNRHAGLLTVVLYAVLKLGIDLILPSDYGSIRIFEKLTLTLCILVVLIVCCYRVAGKIKVFLVVAFLATSEISFFMAYNVFWLGSYLYSLWAWCFKKGYITSVDIFEKLLKATTFGILITMHIVSIVILFVSLKSINRSFREKDYAIHQMELLFVLAPSMTGVFICTLLRMVLVTIESGTPVSLYDKYPSLIIMVPVVLLLSFLSILFGIKLFQDMIYWNREKSSRIILEKQVSSLQEHMGEMERVYSGIRGMRHDMKNTISLIMQLAAGKEEELKAYLEELNETMDRLEFRFKTGNTVVDTLLNMKYHEITRAVPDLRLDVEGLQFPEKLFIQSYDIGIILGNALDNAMEACRKLKVKEPGAEAFIRISSCQKRELFFLKVENSFDGRLLRRRQNEFPVTDKADRENHGIGLANIKSTAEKYQGTMDFKVNGRVFILSVMIKMKGERKMDFGVTGKLGGYYLAEQYRKNAAADKNGGVNFAELAAAKAAGQSDVSGMSFKDMWQARFPGAYYHTADVSDIPQGVWERNDFPFEKFFRNDLDESAVNWKPNGANPAMDSSGVQSRLHSIAGQKSIVVPPELEEKMKNDPTLAKQVMAKVESFIATNQVPGRICSHLIVLDENGEIARFRASSHGGNITGPTEEEMRQLEAEQAAKKKRREEYARLNEESALKRRLMEQEADKRYYRSKAVSIAAYEAAGILM